MNQHLDNGLLFMEFAAVVGAVIAGVIWLYLKIANLGVTIIWDMIPAVCGPQRLYAVCLHHRRCGHRGIP